MNKLIIEKDSLNVLLNNEKKNVNDILKDLWDGNLIDVKMRLTTFYDYYYRFIKEVKVDKTFGCYIILKMCNLLNPHMFNVDLTTNNKDIENEYTNLKKKKIQEYEYKSPNELIATILFHYIINGYTLRICKNCNYFFLSKEKNVYCSDSCRKKNDSIREMNRRNTPVGKLDKQISDILTKRKDEESNKVYKDYKLNLEINKEKMSEQELINWLSEFKQSIKRR